MKLIEILKEVGEGYKDPYAYTEDRQNNRDLFFYWETEFGIEYLMEIQKQDYEKDDGIVTVRYYITFGVLNLEDSEEGVPDFEVTSRVMQLGNVYRTMTTVFDIIKKERERDKVIGKELVELAFSSIDKRRINLYLAYLRKQLPGVEFTVDEDENGRVRVGLLSADKTSRV